MDEWVACQYQHQDDLNQPNSGITVTLSTSPYYEGERWAVRYHGMCLSVKGEWRYEPTPSDRTKTFYNRFRFKNLEAAKKAATKAREELKKVS